MRTLLKHPLAVVGVTACTVGIFADGKVDVTDVRTVGVMLTIVASVATLRRTMQRPWQSICDDYARAGYRLGREASHARDDE